MVLAYIGVGSNLGHRESYFVQARKCLQETEGVVLRRTSSVYETEPVGGPAGQGKYLNAVWELETLLRPRDLLERLLEIERKLGRERRERYAARTMDLDLLAYGDWTVKERGLEIPHPHLHERLFVLRPMFELEPGWVHPRYKKDIRTLLMECHEGNQES